MKLKNQTGIRTFSLVLRKMIANDIKKDDIRWTCAMLELSKKG